jgi:hypothetical protein
MVQVKVGCSPFSAIEIPNHNIQIPNNIKFQNSNDQNISEKISLSRVRIIGFEF